jgi:hypothetical protein
LEPVPRDKDRNRKAAWPDMPPTLLARAEEVIE